MIEQQHYESIVLLLFHFSAVGYLGFLRIPSDVDYSTSLWYDELAYGNSVGLGGSYEG